MRSVKRIIFCLLVLVFFVPTVVRASIGVGVGTGKITVDEQLKPGLIYHLPPMAVLNTGDQASDYEVEMTYNERQPQLKPPKAWFIFSPVRFHLEPGKVQSVDITLNLPLSVTPGDYFGYLEAHPLKADQNGVTSVNIAAAAKLYFTVVPANILQAIMYKVISFFQVYYPWPQRVIGGIIVFVVMLLFKKFFKIEVKKKSSTAPPEES